MNQSLEIIAADSRSDQAAQRQAGRRAAEDQLRARAAQCCQTKRRSSEVARRLRLAPRTLRRWRQTQGHDQPPPPRGRPPAQSSHQCRRAVLQRLRAEGPHLGLPALRALFPEMARAELRELLQRFRHTFRQTYRRSTEVLTWHHPARVWAIDHAQPPNPVDGRDQAVLAVRDLASGMQLAWLPVSDETALVTVNVLCRLIERYGPPLLIKSDNGSAFKSQLFQDLLQRYKIVWLPSPPSTPQYNGSCEASIASMKTRTRYFAERNMRAHFWTRDDLAAARQQANGLARPQGHRAPTPLERWSGRSPISADERAQWAATLARHRDALLAETSADPTALNETQLRRLHRHAVRRALLELGLLTITRRSIPLPIPSPKVAKIS